MNRYKIEIAILVIGFVVGIAGLMQVFHEEAYAVYICDNPGTCDCSEQVPPGTPNRICLCESMSSSNITCEQWCNAGKPSCDIPDP